MPGKAYEKRIRFRFRQKEISVGVNFEGNRDFEACSQCGKPNQLRCQITVIDIVVDDMMDLNLESELAQDIARFLEEKYNSEPLCDACYRQKKT